MSIIKKQTKDATITAKLTIKQKSKIETLAKKHEITTSNLVLQLVESGFKNITKKDL